MNGLSPRSASYMRSSHLPHHVYRCYDADDRLLYVGCTSEIERRMSAHRRGKKGASLWLSVCMARHEVVATYPNRDAALAAEAAMINADQPLFNTQHRATYMFAAWMTLAPIAEYLIEQGHLELALETACGCWRETREAGAFDPWCRPHAAVAAAEDDAA